MKSIVLSSAMKELSARNAAVLAAYRDWARRLPPGPASMLASSMAAQRSELGKALAEIASDISSLPSLLEPEVEFEVDPSPSAVIDAKSASRGETAEPKGILAAMADLETAEHELLAAAAGAALPLSSAAAERLAGEAASARIRSNWAHDHIDLLGMG